MHFPKVGSTVAISLGYGVMWTWTWILSLLPFSCVSLHNGMVWTMSPEKDAEVLTGRTWGMWPDLELGSLQIMNLRWIQYDYVFIKKEKFGYKTHTVGMSYVNEGRCCVYKPKNARDCLQSTRSRDSSMEQTLFHNCQKTPAWPAYWSGPFCLQGWATGNFCCF